MEDLLLYWYEVIEKDLKGFADLHTAVEVEPEGRTLTARWIARGRERHETFRLTPEGDFRWGRADNAGGAVPYREFLPLEGMADFTQLSSAIANAFPEERNYVPTKAKMEARPATEEISDDLLLRELTTAIEGSVGKTRLLFVKGDAGAGKSTLLRQLTGEQARKYPEGHARFLFMYVSAQGRALSNLRDAISGELDDLRAGFTRDAVPALVRHGLLVPIVDGFDELLGAAGYGDAFGSLQQFLGQLDGQGAMVVSARSAFYDVEFVGRRSSEQLGGSQYDVEPISLLAWQDEDLYRYLARVRQRDVIEEKDRVALDTLSAQDRALLSKPFFGSLFPEYVDARERGVGDGSLLDYLVDAYVKREAGKIVDRDSNPLVPVETHKQLFIEATEAMWSYESRDLSEDDLRTLAELVADSSALPGDTAKQFATKITSYMGFQTAKNGGARRFRFEHEVYFDYFLSRALRERLGHPSSMSTFLDGGLIPGEVIRATVDADNSGACLALPGELPHQGVLQDNRRRNLGSLVAAAFACQGDVSDEEVSNLSFVNVSFGRVQLNRIRFTNCIFSNVALDQCRMESCEVRDSHADRIILSESTRMGVAGFDPGRNLLCIHNLDEGRDTCVPSEMVALLRRLGARSLAPPPPLYSQTGQDVVDLLHRVVQKYRRTNLLCLEDDALLGLLRDPSWTALYNLLVNESIVRKESRQAKGSKKTFLRPQVGIQDLFRYEATPTADLPKDQVGDFWRAVREL